MIIKYFCFELIKIMYYCLIIYKIKHFHPGSLHLIGKKSYTWFYSYTWFKIKCTPDKSSEGICEIKCRNQVYQKWFFSLDFNSPDKSSVVFYKIKCSEKYTLSSDKKLKNQV